MTRRKYLAQPEFHQFGVISLSSMKAYRPQYILLCADTPLDQCLCDRCENCELLLKAMHSIGMTDIPSNRYHAVDFVVCSEQHLQVGGDFMFPNLQCILGKCDHCGENQLEGKVCTSNADLIRDKKMLTWHKWMVPSGKSTPEKCQIRGTVSQAVNELTFLLTSLKSHMFRANWNHNLLKYM